MYKLNFDNVLGRQSRYFYMGVAMLWIIGYHRWLSDMTFYNSSFKVFSHFFKFGYVGVDVFFFLSAFGLCHSYANCSLKSFYYKRFTRIIPLFVIYKLLIFVISAGGDFSEFLWHSLLQLTTLSVIQTPLTCPGNLYLDWFVPAILNMYIIFPILFKMIKYLCTKRMRWHVLLLLCTFYGAHFIWGYIDGLYITRLPIIVTGIFTYFYLKHDDYKKCFLLYAIFAMQVFFIERHNLMYSAPVPLILYGLSLSNFTMSEFLPFRMVKKIGEYSFEFFFSHNYAGFVSTTGSLWMNWIIFCCITIVGAIILHYINKSLSDLLLKHIPQ